MRKTIGFGGILFPDRLKSASSFLLWPFLSAMGRLGYATFYRFIFWRSYDVSRGTQDIFWCRLVLIFLELVLAFLDVVGILSVVIINLLSWVCSKKELEDIWRPSISVPVRDTKSSSLAHCRSYSSCTMFKLSGKLAHYGSTYRLRQGHGESGRWCIGFEGDPLMSLTLLRMFTVVHCVQSLCTLQIHNISIIYP